MNRDKIIVGSKLLKEKFQDVVAWQVKRKVHYRLQILYLEKLFEWKWKRRRNATRDQYWFWWPHIELNHQRRLQSDSNGRKCHVRAESNNNLSWTSFLKVIHFQNFCFKLLWCQTWNWDSVPDHCLGWGDGGPCQTLWCQCPGQTGVSTQRNFTGHCQKLHFNWQNKKGFFSTLCCKVQVQVPGQVPGQVQKVQGLRTKDLDLG